MEARPAGTLFSLVSLTRDDVRCHDWLFCRFLTAWGDVFYSTGVSLGWLFAWIVQIGRLLRTSFLRAGLPPR